MFAVLVLPAFFHYGETCCVVVCESLNPGQLWLVLAVGFLEFSRPAWTEVGPLSVNFLETCRVIRGIDVFLHIILMF